MLANLYNQTMYSGAVATGANIIPLDTFSLLQQVAANPNAYGEPPRLYRRVDCLSQAALSDSVRLS